MSDELLAEGTVLKGADSGRSIVVVRHLGGGGQGDVYEVNYAGQRKALKWYRDPALIPDCLYEVLSGNAHKGSPGPEYMWPIETTEFRPVEVTTGDGRKTLDTYGYVMDLIPEGDGGYRSFQDFLRTEVRFASYRVAVDACLEISKVFRVLHSRGLCYQDLNAGNFFFKPDTGDVLICDCDNVAENGISTGILGTPGFMAPELVVDYWESRTVHSRSTSSGSVGYRNITPNYKTDRFSMAVLFFEILTLTNPLSGRCALGPQDDAWRAALYGYDPRFMFDPTSDKNAPVPGIHDNAIAVWGVLPSYMREIFQRAFSQEALRNQNARVTEGEWLDALVRFRADIMQCPRCNARLDLFCDAGAPTLCGACGTTVKPPLVFAFENGIRTPAVPGTRVYRLQVGPTPIGHELDPVAGMICRQGGMADPRQWGVRVFSDQEVTASVGDSPERTFGYGQVIPVMPDLAINVNGRTFRVEINNA